jgi:hypothetical protein
MLNYGIGSHVVCVNADFPTQVKELYTALPVRWQTYVVRDIRLGVTFAFEGDISVLLVGLVNPCAESVAGLERGFMASRFKKPEEAAEIIKSTQIKHDIKTV